MAVTIGKNISAEKAQRQLSTASESVSRVYERLASGSRINHASDDPAGLAVASTLNVDARVFNQGIRNVNDGISYLNVAEGAITELKGIITRISELAEQSANGVYSSTQRSALQNENSALISEYNRILSATKFNGLAVLSSSNSTVSVQAGYGENGRLSVQIGSSTSTVGNGTLQSAVTYSGGGTGAFDVISADFNSDGKTDLLTVGTDTSTLGIFFGNGNGSFKAPSSFSLGATLQAQQAVTADINGDGNLDLAISTYNPGGAHILLGNGNGTFKASTSILTGVGTISDVIFRDLNGDSKLDLVAVREGTNRISVVFGDGAGGFGSENVLVTDTTPRLANLADLNGDGAVDIAVVAVGSDKVDILLGNGNGTFSAKQSFAVGSSPQDVQIADLNGDHNLDLVVASENDSRLNVLLGNGNGTFQARVQYEAGLFVQRSVITDTNNDSILDLVSISSNDAKLSVHLGNGNGTFKARTSYATGHDGNSLVMDDFNSDGVYDVATPGVTTGVLDVFISNTTSSVVGGLSSLSGISVASQSEARSALTTASSYLSDLNLVAGTIGAALSRFQSVIATLASSSENSRAAESRIRDTDIAQDASALTRLSILQQVGSAILAHANSQPLVALSLLKG